MSDPILDTGNGGHVPPQKRNKISRSLAAAPQSLKRYRNLTLSVGAFLTVITGLMIGNHYISEDIQKRQLQIDAAGTLSDTAYDTLTTSQALFLGNIRERKQLIQSDLNEARAYITRLEEAKNRRGRRLQAESGEEAGVVTDAAPALNRDRKHIKDDLEKLSGELSTLLDILDKGGDYDIVEGFSRIEGLVKPEIRAEMKKTQEIWRQYHRLIKDATDADAGYAESEALAEFARENHPLVYEHVDNIISALNDEITTLSNRSQMIQIGGISASILYFLIFIGFFTRKLARSDMELERRNIAMEKARAETERILKTVKSGLFLLDHDNVFGEQRSAETERIFSCGDLSGKDFIEFINDRMLFNREEEERQKIISQLEQYLTYLHSRKKASLFEALNPLREIEISLHQQGRVVSKILKFEFNQVRDSDKNVTGILVSVLDISEAVHLQRKLEKQKSAEYELVETLIRVVKLLGEKPNETLAFIENFVASGYKINQILQHQKEGTSGFHAQADEIKAVVHGIKGEAALLGFSLIVTKMREMEDIAKNIRAKANLDGKDFLPLTEVFNEMLNMQTMLRTLSTQKYISFEESGEYQAEAESSAETKPIDDLIKGIQVLSKEKDKLIVEFLDSLKNLAADIAGREGKQVRLLTVGFDRFKPTNEQFKILRTIIIQMIRNAVVHGIEKPEEREAQGKDPQGDITVGISKDNDTYYVFVKDDGRGIDVDAIRQKAVVTGILDKEMAKKMSHERLMRMIFDDNFSTRDEVNDDAGQGIGMKVIKDKIRELGGELKVRQQQGAGTEFRISFKAFQEGRGKQ